MSRDQAGFPTSRSLTISVTRCKQNDVIDKSLETHQVHGRRRLLVKLPILFAQAPRRTCRGHLSQFETILIALPPVPRATKALTVFSGGIQFVLLIGKGVLDREL